LTSDTVGLMTLAFHFVVFDHALDRATGKRHTKRRLVSNRHQTEQLKLSTEI
jgi:hypothetical protein